MNKKFIQLILLFLFTSIIYPQTIQITQHPFSGKVVMSLAGGGTIPFSDYTSPKINLFGEGSLGYYFDLRSRHTIGLQIYGAYGSVGGEDGTLFPNIYNSTIAFLGGGFTYSYFMSGHFTPYLYAGMGYLWFNPKDDKNLKLPNSAINNGDLAEVTYNFKAGIDYFIAKNLSLNFNAGIILGKSDLVDGFIQTDSRDDAVLTASLGFSYAFPGFGKGGIKDSDGDGVPDDEDKCPGTPAGTKVTVDGCPIDADGDGVPDLVDRCPNSPKGVFVDSNGCPVDTDGDGIPDYRDQCPNTPDGIIVNMFGCPIDRDGDGVPDYKDKCPGTPEGITVDKNGCPPGYKPIEPSSKPIITNPVITPSKPRTEKNYILKTYNPPVTGNYNVDYDKNVKGNIWSDGSTYVVQHSSWLSSYRAGKVSEGLKAKGHNSFVYKVYIPKFGKTYYRVRVGYFNSLSEALNYERNLK